MYFLFYAFALNVMTREYLEFLIGFSWERKELLKWNEGYFSSFTIALVYTKDKLAKL